MNKQTCIKVMLFSVSLWTMAFPARAEASAPEQSALFRVTLLGTGVPQPQIRRSSYSTLVEAGSQKLLFDFGRNAATRLWQMKIPLSQIDSYFLTHFHSDHTVGLADLWLTGWLPSPYGGRTNAMALYGPEGIKAMADGLQQTYAKDIKMRHEDEGTALDGVKIDVTEIKSGVVYDKDGVKVIAFDNDHGVHIKPSFGYKIEYKGHSVVLSGDTRYTPEVVKQAKGADLLVHCVAMVSDEFMQANPVYKKIADHLASPEDAARIFDEAKPKLAVFSHIGLNGNIDERDLVREVKNRYSGPFVVGEDLMHFEIPTTAKDNGIVIWQSGNN